VESIGLPRPEMPVLRRPNLHLQSRLSAHIRQFPILNLESALSNRLPLPHLES